MSTDEMIAAIRRHGGARRASARARRIARRMGITVLLRTDVGTAMAALTMPGFYLDPAMAGVRHAAVALAVTLLDA